MRFGHFSEARRFVAFVNRLLELDSRLPGSAVAGYRSVSPRVAEGIGVNGVLPNGTVIRIAYLEDSPDVTYSQQLHAKVKMTFSSLSSNAARIKRIVGTRPTRIIFIFPVDPPITAVVEAEALGRTHRPQVEPSFWGESRLVSMLNRHWREMTDFSLGIELSEAEARRIR